MTLNSKASNTFKQFGFLYFIKALFNRLITPIVRKTSFYIVAIENHTPVTQNNEDFEVVDKNNLDDFFKRDIKLSEQLKRQLTLFITQNTIAIIIIRDNQIAGWGFVQKSGISKYAGYNYYLTKNIQLLKNLYIEPAFRGRSIGKIINKIRISFISTNNIPIGFVVPSNKYAMRNLEMHGFTKQVFVIDYLWFKKYHKRSLKTINNNLITKTIINGFKNE